MKRIFAILVVVAILAVGGLFLGRQVLFGFLTPDALVERMERSWNCRAEMGDIHVTLGQTARVEISGLAMGERDETVEQGIPLKERTPLAAAIVRGESVVLEVRPAALFRKRLDVRRLTLGGLEVNTVIDRDGGNSLERLFATMKVDGDAETTASAAPADRILTQKTENRSGIFQVSVVEESGEQDAFNVAEMPFVTVANDVEIRNGTMIATIEASGTRALLENLHLNLSKIDVDPGNLAEHNEAIFQIESDLAISGDGAGGEHLRAKISGQGVFHPFDAQTGEIDPAWSTEIVMHQGAALDTIPILETLREKLDKIDTAGVDLSDIHVRGELQSDAATRIAHRRGIYTFESPLELRLPDADLVVHEGSWLNAGTNTHEIRGAVKVSEALTGKIKEKVDHYLEKKAGNFASEGLRELVLSPVMEDGRIVLEVVSQGDMSRPKVDVVTAFGNLTDVIKSGKDSLKLLEEAGKSLLKNLFGQ